MGLAVLLYFGGSNTVWAADATADEFGCPAAAYGGLNFDDDQHRLWYRRFWTGTCQGLPLFTCFSGRPYWSETMQNTLQKIAPAGRADAKLKMCAIGKLIGHEWAKDNNIRRIDTQLVSVWIERLEKSADPIATLHGIDAEAKQQLGRP